MIKKEKDLSTIPDSLKPAIVEFFPGKIPIQARKTHIRRMEIIGNGSYIDEHKYNARYKIEDVKTAIKEIYNNKCAFCEQRIEQSHIEHYRPKNVYYWLAYSWDNLILACATCNSYKSTNFRILGVSAAYHNTPQNLVDIHNSSVNADIQEAPLMVNPEITNPLGEIRFYESGLIDSLNDRFSYTITTCKIDRVSLNDQRRAILDTFKSDIRAALVENSDLNDQLVAVRTIVSKFVRDTNLPETQFVAFRTFAILNWIKGIVKLMT